MPPRSPGFGSKIVAGPGDGDCSISIGADGYGRFFITRAGMGFCVPPNRYAPALAIGSALGADVFGGTPRSGTRRNESRSSAGTGCSVAGCRQVAEWVCRTADLTGGRRRFEYAWVGRSRARPTARRRRWLRAHRCGASGLEQNLIGNGPATCGGAGRRDRGHKYSRAEALPPRS